MIKIFVYLTLVILMISIYSAFPQNPKWINYNASYKEVLCLAVDHNDLWLGTTNGIVKMNISTGLRTYFNMSNSGLPSNYVCSIGIDLIGHCKISIAILNPVPFNKNIFANP